MRAVGVGLLVEEQRGDVVAAWKRAVEEELGGEAALAFAVGPLLREMGLALRDDGARLVSTPSRPHDGALRSAVLVRSSASPARIAREFKLVHRALWLTLRSAGHVVGADERRAADEWLDEALASTLERLDRVRTRLDLLDGAAAPFAARASPPAVHHPQRPPPLPWARARAAAPAPLPATVDSALE